MSRHTIAGVPSFERNHDAGSMAMLALETVLRTQGEDCPEWWLAGMSGDAFKFVYDVGAVFEPLRDRVPLDVLSQACRAAGREGYWRLGASMEEAVALVRDAVGRGCPAIAPFLGTRWYHGMVLAVGVDEDAGAFVLQIARDDASGATDYETVAIPQSWNGPVPGGAIWADNPLFLVGERRPPSRAAQSIEEALARAVSLHAGPPLPYSDHAGAQEYSRPPLAGRVALQGEAGLRALDDDIDDGDFITFDIIWRIDAQLGQLHHDRGNAARFLRAMSREHPAKLLLLQAADLYAATAEVATRIQHAYWDKRTAGAADRRSVRAAVEDSASLVYAVGGLPAGELDALRHATPVLDTPWGAAAIADGTRRRRGMRDLVDRILEQEGRCAALLMRALE